MLAATRRIREALNALQGAGALPIYRTTVRAAPSLTTGQDLTIESTAAQTISRWTPRGIASNYLRRPLSESYARFKSSLGLPSQSWNLILTGRLASTLEYFIRDGALWARYAPDRDVVVKGLKDRSGREDLLHPSPEEAKAMALEVAKQRVQNFLLTWQRKK